MKVIKNTNIYVQIVEIKLLNYHNNSEKLTKLIMESIKNINLINIIKSKSNQPQFLLNHRLKKLEKP